MAEERLGASFSIDVSQLQAGLKTANRLIRESQSEFKAAAAGMENWSKSEEGLTARNKALTTQMQLQQQKVDALKQNYQNLINQGLDPTSDRAIQLRTQINNEEAALNRCKTEIDKNTQSLADLGDESEEAGKDAEKGSEGFTVMKGVLANLATQGITMALNGLKQLGAAAINLGKSAIESYADYEQLVGGVETLFGAGGQSLEEYAKSVGKSVNDAKGDYDKLMSAQDAMITNANNAYKTAGMSANEYMTNVTGFSASLISSLGGDTVAAAAAADRAMTDISDNANKMGTDMQSIVDTYQSLARGNYQMLDNLKLGYGGTKSEMERMIADANAVKKANGEMANLSVDSFADVTEAIHIIQNEMGITGTTAKEAESTISGSVGMMKASWQNLLTGMADDTMDFDQLIANFVDSVQAAATNLVPRIATVMGGIIKLIEALLPEIPALLQEFLPTLVEGVTTLIQGLANVLPDVLDTLLEVLPTFLTALIELLPTILETLISMTASIIQSLAEMMPTVVDAIVTVIPLLVSTLVENLPTILEAGIQLFMALVDAIPQIIPPLMEALPSIIEAIVNMMANNIELILNAGIQLLMAIVDALPVIIQSLVENLPKIITTIVTVLIQNLPSILNAAIQLFMALIQAIPQVLPLIVQAIPQIVSAIVQALTSPEMIESLKAAGSELIKGLWQGISDMTTWIGEKIKGFGDSVVSGLKSFFGIASPSKLMENMIGKNLALGIGKGFEENIGKVNREIQDAMNFEDATFNVNGTGRVRTVGGGVVINQTNNYSQAHSRYEIYKSKQQTAAAVRLALSNQ